MIIEVKYGPSTTKKTPPNRYQPLAQRYRMDRIDTTSKIHTDMDFTPDASWQSGVGKYVGYTGEEEPADHQPSKKRGRYGTK